MHKCLLRKVPNCAFNWQQNLAGLSIWHSRHAKCKHCRVAEGYIKVLEKSQILCNKTKRDHYVTSWRWGKTFSRHSNMLEIWGPWGTDWGKLETLSEASPREKLQALRVAEMDGQASLSSMKLSCCPHKPGVLDTQLKSLAFVLLGLGLTLVWPNSSLIPPFWSENVSFVLL